MWKIFENIQIKLLVLKTGVCEAKNTLSRTNGRLDIVREKISELEDIAVKTILNETPRTVNTWTECQ